MKTEERVGNSLRGSVALWLRLVRQYAEDGGSLSEDHVATGKNEISVGEALGKLKRRLFNMSKHQGVDRSTRF